MQGLIADSLQALMIFGCDESMPSPLAALPFQESKLDAKPLVGFLMAGQQHPQLEQLGQTASS